MTDADIITKLERVVTQVEDVYKYQTSLNAKLEANIDELYNHTRELQTKVSAQQANCIATHKDCDNRHNSNIRLSFRQLIMLIIIIASLSIGGNYTANLLGGL